MKLLLDSDMLLFRAMTATEVEFEVLPDVFTRHSELPEARAKYWDMCDDLAQQVDMSVDDVWHCFTSRSMFRRRICPDYKANRKATVKPLGYQKMRAEIMNESTAFMFDEIEADDVLGIFATMIDDERVVIASGDKDLNQIPGEHVWLDKEPWEQDPRDARRFIYKQILTGDRTDGVTGCPGMGEVRAQRIVDELNIYKPLDCWQEIVRTYETKGGVANASEYATKQTRLVKILQAGEYDFNTHAVKLWNPPTR
jgi:DNA polymerase-1